MNGLKILLVLVFVLGNLMAVQRSVAEELPDALVRRISQEVLNLAKADQEIQAGNQKRVLDLVQAKILPYVDFQRMTAQATGHNWRAATPEQQRQLSDEFRTLLIFTYSGAIAQLKDEKLVFKPMRGDPAASDVEVRSEVQRLRGEPIQLNYRLEKTALGWRIYDVGILGAWLVESYKSSFSAEIGKGGIDGLIRTLSDKNRKLSSGAANTARKSS